MRDQKVRRRDAHAEVWVVDRHATSGHTGTRGLSGFFVKALLAVEFFVNTSNIILYEYCAVAFPRLTCIRLHDRQCTPAIHFLFPLEQANLAEVRPYTSTARLWLDMAFP